MALFDVGKELSLEPLRTAGLPVDAEAHESPKGLAWSLEPNRGDPRFVVVLPSDCSEPFWVDRRTMRSARTPRKTLVSERDAVRAADLADRAQLALGEPLCVGFAFRGGRMCITQIERARARFSFTLAAYRCIAPFVGDRNTLAPLSIDALDRALRVEEDRGDEHRVRRMFARAYRKVDAHHTPWSRSSRGRRLRSVERFARLARDVVLAADDAQRYRIALAQGAGMHDQTALAQLDRADLIEALRKRMSLVVSALVLLERDRMATLGLLPGLEQFCPQVDRVQFLALAEPIYTDERLAVDKRLLALAELADGRTLILQKPSGGDALVQWEKLKRTLRHVRCLGMDVRPSAMGEDDGQLLHALHEVRARYASEPSEQRAAARAALMHAVLRGRLGVTGVPGVLALIRGLERLSRAKGVVAEGLSAALLRLRVAALEAGERLAEDGMLERADDTLYLTLEEIEQALEGELGAYAARVRARREDDRRWRHFAAPRAIAARDTVP